MYVYIYIIYIDICIYIYMYIYMYIYIYIYIYIYVYIYIYIYCMLIHSVRKAKNYYAHDGQIWLLPFGSWDSKMCFISRIN